MYLQTPVVTNNNHVMADEFAASEFIQSLIQQKANISDYAIRSSLNRIEFELLETFCSQVSDYMKIMVDAISQCLSVEYEVIDSQYESQYNWDFDNNRRITVHHNYMGMSTIAVMQFD